LIHRVSFVLVLEEFVHLLEHLFYAEANGIALFVESGEFGFGGAGVALIQGQLFTERGDFSLGCGAGFTLFFDDFYGTEDFLLERLEFICADTRVDGRCTHIFPSIDGGGVDLLEGNWGGIYLGARFQVLNAGDGEGRGFSGGDRVLTWFFDGNFVVN
jgi:hypothetical protein